MLFLVSDDRFADHLNPPGHPERVERAAAMRAIAERWAEAGVPVVAARPAIREELLRVHDEAHVDRIEATAGRAVMLDADTFTSPDTSSVAALAAGGALLAVERVMAEDRVARALALVRPPGHHAERARAMGFCIYNNIALAAAHALARGVERVAVVDVDVHHGNGTQWAFYDNPRVLFMSIHQYPFYPGTGWAGEAGVGPGEGFTVNVPMEVGATDGDYALVFETLIVPVLAAFQPGLVCVSAGFDVHALDPLGGMRVSTAGCAALVERLVLLEPFGSRMVLAVEGGYHPEAFPACLDATIRVLARDENLGSRPAPLEEDSGPSDYTAATRRGPAAVELVRAAQARYWPGI